MKFYGEIKLKDGVCKCLLKRKSSVNPVVVARNETPRLSLRECAPGLSLRGMFFMTWQSQ